MACDASALFEKENMQNAETKMILVNRLFMLFNIDFIIMFVLRLFYGQAKIISIIQS